MAHARTHDAVEAVFRRERAGLIARLVWVTRDVDLAEELAQDALVSALAEWPRTGVPHNPAAWLVTAARRRALDAVRRRAMQGRKHAEIGRAQAAVAGIETVEAALDDAVGDEMLALIFVACHPVLAPDARAALTLRLIGGLTNAEIARAFLTGEATVAQRIVRAKRTLAADGGAYAVPDRAGRGDRLASVLEVVYLIFNEGYAPTLGPGTTRPDLCGEAQRLGRLLADLTPDAPEVFGLLALMEIQASRLPARAGPDGIPLSLPDQDRARWDRPMIARGLAALDRARRLRGDGPADAYALQAEIAACHARAGAFADTDWRAIAGHYDALCAALPSPVVALNRAIAHGMAFGPEAGLAGIAAIAGSAALRDYAPLPAARGDCLVRAGRGPEARTEFERAAALTRNPQERAFLLARAAACPG